MNDNEISIVLSLTIAVGLLAEAFENQANALPDGPSKQSLKSAVETATRHLESAADVMNKEWSGRLSLHPS